MTGSQSSAILQCIEQALGVDGKLARSLVEGFIADFVQPLKQKLNKITFRKLISRKNPYLYRASRISTIENLVDRALSDFASSSTEGLFGTAMERIITALPGNIKSSAQGVDVERRWGNIVELFAIKSGPAGYNSSSFRTQRQHLSTSKTILEQQKNLVVNAYVGFIYGRKRRGRPQAGYTVLSSKELWSKLSGDDSFYRKLLDAYGCVAALYEADITATRQRLLNEARAKFTQVGKIDWDAILRASSG